MNRGFTLIEVLITLTILAFLGYFTSQTIQTSVQFKRKFQASIDQQSLLQSAMQIMERDINLAFHHQDVLGKMTREAIKEAQATPTPPINPNAPPAFPTTAPSDTTEESKKTQFMGDETKLAFTSRSNVRMMADVQESDLAEIAYELKSCPGSAASTSDQKSGGQCIVRRVTPYLDEDVTKGPVEDESVLIRDVTDFRLRYIGDGKQDAVTTWHTDASGDAATKDNFPFAVEITLTTDHVGRGRKATLSTVATLRFPNNPPKAKEGETKSP